VFQTKQRAGKSTSTQQEKTTRQFIVYIKESKDKHWHTGMKEPGREKVRGKRRDEKRTYSATEYE
jgi:hypothetical protein